LKTHGINYKEVKGYIRLDDLNKLLYEKFVVNLFNSLGLDSRMVDVGLLEKIQPTNFKEPFVPFQTKGRA